MNERLWPPQLNREKHLLLWMMYFAIQLACVWWIFGLPENYSEVVEKYTWVMGPSMLATFLLVALKKKRFDSSSLNSACLAMVMLGWPLGLMGMMVIQTEAAIVLGPFFLLIGIISLIVLPFTQNRFAVWIFSGFLGFIMPLLLFFITANTATAGEKLGKASVSQPATVPPRSASGLFTSEYGKLTHENITVIVRGGQLEQPTEITISKEPFTPSDFEKTAGAWRLLEKFTIHNNTGKVRNAQAEIIVKMDLKEELKENEEPRVELAFRADGSEKSQMIPYIGPILEELGDGVYSFETNLSESETLYGKGTHIVYYLYASPK